MSPQLIFLHQFTQANQRERGKAKAEDTAAGRRQKSGLCSGSANFISRSDQRCDCSFYSKSDVLSTVFFSICISLKQTSPAAIPDPHIGTAPHLGWTALLPAYLQETNSQNAGEGEGQRVSNETKL